MQDTAYIELKAEDVMRGKYLTFRVDDGDYGIEIRFVTEIIGVQEVTPVPHTHDYVKGIMNLRGTIIPIIDMRMRFGREETQYTDRTCIVVLSMDEVNIGLIVDQVQEVVDIEDGGIRVPPKMSGDIGQNFFVKGIGMAGEKIKQLLDINKMFEMEGEAAAS